MANAQVARAVMGKPKGEVELASKKGAVAVQLLGTLYGPDQDAEGGQIRALADLVKAQDAGRGSAPSPLFNVSRDIFSRNTLFSRRLYHGLRGQGLQRTIPALDGPTRIPSLRAALQARWGLTYANPDATLSMLRARALPNLSGGPLTHWILGSESQREAGWRQQNSFGLVADAYLSDLMALHRLFVQQEKQEQAARLFADMMVIVDDLAGEKLKAAAEDRGLLICGTHAGPFRFGYYYLDQMFPSMIALAGKGDSSKELVATDPVRALYSLTKQLRKPGAVALIGADGPEGASIGSAPVRDLEVPIRLGAPTLVYNTRCASVFFLSRWTDRGLVFECRDVPAISPGNTFKDWSREWLNAYGAVMSDLTTGHPANVQGAWGMWKAIRWAIDHRKHLNEDAR